MKMREQIAAGSFIGFVGGLILFIIFFNAPFEFSLANLKFALIVWVLAYASFLLFGFTKEGLFAFGLAIYRILTDRTSTNEQKFQMLMQSAQSVLNVAADLSFIVQAEKNEKTPIIKEVLDESKKIEPLE